MTERRPQTESELTELIRASDVRAPDALHRRVESLIASRSQRRWRLPGLRFPGAATRSLGGPRLASAGALALVIAIVVAIVTSAGGGGGGLSVSDASALTLRPATAPAPAESIGNRAELRASVDGIAFPYWGERFGWRSTGARSDRVGGRTVTTVFYADVRGLRIGYAIVAGTPAPTASGGVVAWRGRSPYRLLHEHGAVVVVWQRAGRLCVVSGRGISAATLLRLASWGDERRGPA